jgi:hypothetical protein
MSPSTDTRSFGRIAPTRFAPSRPGIAVTVVLVLVLAALYQVLPGPRHVAAITFDNPTVYAITIESSNGGGDGWVTVGTARADTTTVSHEVIDEGGTWAFRFTGQGLPAGGEVVSRADLEEAGWLYTIPAEVGDRLAAMGAPPTP